MASKWSAKVNTYTGSDAVTATLGTLADAGKQLRTNTSIPWFNQPLAIFANDTVIQSVISPFGGFFRMRSDAALELWGGYTDQDALVSLSRADAGEPSAHKIELAATSDSWLYDGSVFIDANAASTGALGNYNAQVNVAANNSTITTQVLNRVSTAEGAWIDVVGFAAQTNDFSFRISDEGGVVIKFSPFCADDGTVVYLLDTSNALENNLAVLLSVCNNQSKQLEVSKNGGLSIGANTIGVYGSLPVDGRALFCARVVDEGDPAQNGIELACMNGAVSGTFGCNQTPSSSYLYCSWEDESNSSIFDASLSETQSLIRLWFAGAVKTRLEPSVSDGASATAYLFDTSNALADNSVRLMSVNNSGTEHFLISRDGGIAVGSGTVAAIGVPTAGEVLFSVQDGDGGGPNFAEIYVTTKSTNNESGHDLTCTNSTSNYEIFVELSGVTSSFKFEVSTSGLALEATFADTLRMGLHPDVGDLPNEIAYLFDTALAITDSSVRLIAVKNHGTLVASIDKDGHYFVGTDQVVGARVVDARIDDAINSGDATTDGVIDACRDALIAHGLCTAA